MFKINAVSSWIEKETGLVTIIRDFLEEPLPKGVGWAHVFGSVVLLLFLFQLLTGAFIMIYYTPTPDHAYESVEYIQRLAFGRIVRGLHHFGSSAMVLFVGIHMVQVWLWGAYKKPRQIIWVIGVLLLLITLAFAFTGYLLPWDQKAYWATVVGTNIAASIPFIGESLKLVLRGGESVGATTLTRFFAIHVFLLPGLITAGILFHIYQVRKKGITPPWSKVDEEPTEKPLLFHPDQVFKDLVAALVVLMILLFLAASFGAPLEDRANPADTTYVPRPEWYFLPLFQLLKYLPGQYGEFVGAILIPTVGALLLMLFPYFDRNPERRPSKRPFAVGVALALFIVATVLGVQGVRSTPAPKRLNAIEARGEKLFMDLRCSTCHGINGGGGITGADLAIMDDRNPTRIETVLRKPQAFNPRSIMPSYDHLTDAQIASLVAYITALGPGSKMPRIPQVGPRKPLSHFEEDWMLEHKLEVRKDPKACANCHKPAFCQTCHQKRRPDSHLSGWIKAHFGTATEKPEYCAICHEKSYCLECHQDVLHTPNWLREHERGVKARSAICQECHTQRSFCIACHKGAEPKSHTPGWIASHGSLLRTGKESQQTCTTCHEQRFCTSCHEGAKPASHNQPNFVKEPGLPRKPGEVSGHAMEALKGLRQGAERCATCHSQNFCNNCHGIQMPHPPNWLTRPGTQASSPSRSTEESGRVAQTKSPRKISASTVTTDNPSLSKEQKIALASYLRQLDSPRQMSACPAQGGTMHNGFSEASGSGKVASLATVIPNPDNQKGTKTPSQQKSKQPPSKQRVSVHAVEALGKPATCTRCHTPQECLNCHQVAMPHPTGWSTQHADTTLNKPAVCARCHTPTTCNKCHGDLPPVSHDAENYAGKPHAEDTQKRSQTFCLLCHKPTHCNDCHRAKTIRLIK